MVVLRAVASQRRNLCTANVTSKAACVHPTSRSDWRFVKQVTKSNFLEALEEIRSHISDSHFVAVSLQKTGTYSTAWQKSLPLDSSEIAYYKAKYAAEKFQILQFAVCPFSIRASKLYAHPYNFYLFPRDELRIGMPSYSFSCQSTYLECMAKEGFDFNSCIYEGISYLSRAQESAAKVQLGNPGTSSHVIQSSSSSVSVADSLFMERVKSRVRLWLNACKDVDKTIDEALIKSLRKVVLGSEEYNSRPSFCIDVCSERQVQLALETLKEFSNDVVPLLIPGKGGGTLAVRVVLTSSEEDRVLFKKELQDLQEKQSKQDRGFRELIELISNSQKPVVAHNSLNDFTFIYSKFLAPLPHTMDEFRSSLHLVFPQVLDINHLMEEIAPLKKVANLSKAMSHIQRRFFTPVTMEISHQAGPNVSTIHGHGVLRITELFAKLYTILKVIPATFEADKNHLSLDLERHANVFDPCLVSCEDTNAEEVCFSKNDIKKVSCNNLVFLWGFRGGMSSATLKSRLYGLHEAFSKDFDVRLVDKSCAAVVFWNPGSSERFLEAMDSGGVCSEPLKEIISQGLRAASYQTYQKVCRLGLWETQLGDALDNVLSDSNSLSDNNPEKEPSEVSWNELIINLDGL